MDLKLLLSVHWPVQPVNVLKRCALALAKEGSQGCWRGWVRVRVCVFLTPTPMLLLQHSAASPFRISGQENKTWAWWNMTISL